MRYRTPLLALLALLGLLLYSTGCDSAPNPVAPTGSVLTVTANPTFIGLSGSSTITVSGFKPDGNPLNPGTLINLSTSQGAIPSVVEADSTGRATATFTADERVGTATVTASLPGNEATATAMVEIGEQRPVLEISANPSTIAVGLPSTITIIARDFNGFAIPSDGPIVLTATNGTLSSSNIRTNRNGVAETVFTAGDEFSGNGSVSAFLRNSETVSTEITIRDRASGLTLAVDPLDIDRLEEGDTLTLTSFVTNAQGNPVGNIVVTFTSDPGVFPITLVPTNNAEGRASTTLTITKANLDTVPDGGSFLIRATITSEGIVVPSTPSEVRIAVMGAR